ncbi:hypothetical protein [Jatrophihabitans endophyticus]|uniref:hypothetical protein n=1 Tax=Jatrophihabitans endophyticus TaxID=1206085 RepID=UPI0019EB8795|nr:hypothetical protein [Jatrophihabitans endophyticus]MBE7189064.1 hypothetical protein [Jatrophihabitans endophyticus]
MVTLPLGRSGAMSTRVRAGVLVASLGAASLAGLVAAAPADALPGTVCMTHQQFFDHLHPATQRTLYRGGSHKWGISDVRCDHGWAAALATVRARHGGAGYGYTVTEHRGPHGVWHQIARAKPCREHKIPKKIFVQFCESN